MARHGTAAASGGLFAEAVARAATDRQRALIGLHDPYFYDG